MSESNFNYFYPLDGKYTAQRGYLRKLFGRPTDELQPFTKDNETGPDQTTNSTALLCGKFQVSISVYYYRQNRLASTGCNVLP